MEKVKSIEPNEKIPNPGKRTLQLIYTCAIVGSAIE